MKKKTKCFFCEKKIYCPYSITEIEKGQVESYHMCAKCGEEYNKVLQKTKSNPVYQDVTLIKTPDQLIDLLFGLGGIEVKPPCQCGLTSTEFEKTGRFGCEYCYTHFPDMLEQFVFPYHNASRHYGKRPKNYEKPMDKEEKRKLLKLKLAKAVELEEYEKAGVFKKELEQLNDDWKCLP